MQMIRPLCDPCSLKPKGIEGHDSLMRDPAETDRRTGSPAAVYICGHCRARWSRSYVGDGLFTWQPFPSPASIEPPRETES
jgi:hypothetical protein